MSDVATEGSNNNVTTKRKKPLTPAEKLEKLEAQQAQIQARIKNEKAKLSKEKRKQDTRRKIIVGALAIEHAELQPQSEFAAELNRLITRHVKESDRHLFE